IITSKVMIRKYGDDPSVVVIDEVVGMWITMLIFNLLTSFENVSLINLIILFLAFRFFDIVKIQPAKYFDKMENAFGIMMDDVIAGIYAGFTVYLITLIFRQI
ncbi:MAG: phosphatidylglycerophosphatase A, partial [Ignavibacteria bacterium]|nr:phosphatidylglycerophosphatase A [Ignavibacteria bacterium]